MHVANFRRTSLLAAVAIVAFGSTIGCGSDPPPPPDLTPEAAAALITQKWAQDEMNHFKVNLNSDGLVECGVQQGLWNLVEINDRYGNPGLTMYQLSDKGHKVFTSVHLRDAGRGHEVLLKGPYRMEVTNITDGQPNTKNVEFHWEIDWDKAPEDLKRCMPRFELSGSETAVFDIADNNWRFLSYLKYLSPDDQQQQQQPQNNLQVLDHK